ncbi:MAG: ATP-binding protein [Clostridiales bacterium]|jgi:hypothetical protein|nr:ATP-binding protein [Clostridiales bacterium]
MIKGNVEKIDLSTSSFERIISDQSLYVDKTRLIEHFLGEISQVQLIARHRRLGKSLNMDMLRLFLTDSVDYRHLFKGLYIESSPVWNQAHSAPVLYFDFKNLSHKSYQNEIFVQIAEYLDQYIDIQRLSPIETRRFNQYLDRNGEDHNGLLYLTKLIYKQTGKRSYIFIDEYDKLLMDSYHTDQYEEIQRYETLLLSAGLKGNPYLAKALLTGVLRISHESMLSGLNNLKTYDVFSDRVFTYDYGLTDWEIDELRKLTHFDRQRTKDWYNGIKIGGSAIYNIYSTMAMLDSGKFDCFWGKSGMLDIILNLLTDERKALLERLLNGDSVEVEVAERISVQNLYTNVKDSGFFSLLVQAGYLSLDEEILDKNLMRISIPNRELSIVWKEFIFDQLYNGARSLKTLFDHTDDMERFAENIESFLSDSLSYHDLAVYSNERGERVEERIYHIFTLGILSAYKNATYKKPMSNRESGDGRYDILVEKDRKNFIFEFKSRADAKELVATAQQALAQIDEKRYGADLDKNKPLIKIGIAFSGKLCKAICEQ